MTGGLIAAALLHAGGSPPIYDSVSLPAEPYNWESPPPEFQNGNKPPLSGSSKVAITNGQVAGGSVRTEDNQVVMYFGAGALTAPAGSQRMTCTIEPVPNPPPAPSGVELRGNVYRIDCVAEPSGAPAALIGTAPLTLRLPPGTTNNIRYFDGRSWRILPTAFSPRGDPYGGVHLPGFGDIAATARVDILTILGRYVEFFGILTFVVVFGIIAVVQEVRRRRRQQTPKPSSKR